MNAPTNLETTPTSPVENQLATPQKPAARRVFNAIRKVAGVIDRTFIHLDQEKVKPEDITLQKVAEGLSKKVTHPTRLRTRPEDFVIHHPNDVLDELGYAGKYPPAATYMAERGLRTLTAMSILDMKYLEDADRNEWRLAEGKLPELQQVSAGKLGKTTLVRRP